MSHRQRRLRRGSHRQERIEAADREPQTGEGALRNATMDVPLKMGANRQQVAGPEEENWPRDSSMKKMGMPTSSSMMQ